MQTTTLTANTVDLEIVLAAARMAAEAQQRKAMECREGGAHKAAQGFDQRAQAILDAVAAVAAEVR